MLEIIKKREKGFTLIELLLVSAILLLASASVVMLFTGGRKTWSSSDKDSETIQNAVVGMEKLVREIKNSPGLTDYSTTFIRFKVLRIDSDDIDGDGNTSEYIEKYATAKLGSGSESTILKYGESDTDVEGTLSNLAYPVTNLSFSFKKADGTDAVPGTDLPTDVKSVAINMTTADGGVEIPLTSRTYLVMGTPQAVAEGEHPDGTTDPNPDDDGDGIPDIDDDDDDDDGISDVDDGDDDGDGTPDIDDDDDDNNSFEEGDEETDDPPSPGSPGDGIGGWSLSDYAVYGDRASSLSNSCIVYGSVGTRCLSGAAYNSQNSVKVYGYLVAKGSYNMSNSGAVTGSVGANGNVIAPGSVLAAVKSGSSTNFANSSKVNGSFWTLNNITMSNSSWINGTVFQPTNELDGQTISPAKSIVCHNSSKYNKKTELKNTPKFMKDPMDYPEADRADMWGDSVFPSLPPAEDVNSHIIGYGSTDKSYWAKSNQTLAAGNYRDLNVGNSSVTLTAGSKFRNADINNSSILNIPVNCTFNNLSISNSSQVNLYSYNNAPGVYYFNAITMSNSSKIRFNFINGNPILLLVKTTVNLSNSSSFEYINGGTNNGADLVYLEAGTGLTCSNSVQWRGYVYVPNGDINFSNSTNLAGAAFASGAVNLANSVTVTYVPPRYKIGSTTYRLLSQKFYPQENP